MSTPARVTRSMTASTRKKSPAPRSDKKSTVSKTNLDVTCEPSDAVAPWLYKPHHVFAGVMICLGLMYLSFNDAGSPRDNMIRGFQAVGLFIIVFGLVVFPNGPFVRPHAFVWRFGFGVGVVYELVLIMLLMQSKSGARAAMTLYDPSYNTPLAHRSYATACELTFDNVKAAVVDEFFLSHFIGWIVKTLMLRDRLVCWAISIQWELIELSLLHWLPNFAECWWDQWILDVLVSNGIGIFLGWKLGQYLKIKEFTWGGQRDSQSSFSQVCRQLTRPVEWTEMNWNYHISVKRFWLTQLIILFLHINELNCFLLKHLLWIPVLSRLNVYRLIVWFIMATPCMRQLYEFVSNPNADRIGKHTLLAFVVMMTEIALILKLSPGEFTAPMDPTYKVGTVVGVVLYAFFCILASYFIHMKNQSAKQA